MAITGTISRSTTILGWIEEFANWDWARILCTAVHIQWCKPVEVDHC